jgi:alcohol dehydrogenase (cytochrome c)
MLATPDLVFTGLPSGEVMALDAKTLEKRWEFNTGGGVSAPPMSFSVDGKQYIGILVGLGGAWDKWFIESTPELKRMQPGSVLYVFAL